MAIVKIDYADVTDVLTGNVQTPFEIDSYTNTTIPKLQVGRCEEIGGSLYRVETSEVTPTGSPADGVIYLYVEDLGSSIATTLSATVPTFDPELGGYYNGNAKAVFTCTKSGSTYTKKARIVTHQGISFGGDTNIRRTASGELEIDGNVTVNGDVTVNGYISPDLNYSLTDNGTSSGIPVTTSINIDTVALPASGKYILIFSGNLAIYGNTSALGGPGPTSKISVTWLLSLDSTGANSADQYSIDGRNRLESLEEHNPANTSQKQFNRSISETFYLDITSETTLYLKGRYTLTGTWSSVSIVFDSLKYQFIRIG